MTTRKEKFISALKTKTPGLSVEFKDESLFMKILGFILFFNKEFMTSFVTTIGKTIYFPSRANLLVRGEQSALVTLAHEYQHVKDYESNRLWFLLSYLFPICLLPLMLVSFAFLPWFVSLLLCLTCLAPLPSYWRKKWEVRGYTMSMFAYDKLAREGGTSIADRHDTLNSLPSYYNTHFTGPNYYYMWPFGVEDELDYAVDAILSGELEKSDDIFSDVTEALKKSKVEG